ncbi:MAG: BMC domain-containing protein [Pirellulaceae bacterium]
MSVPAEITESTSFGVLEATGWTPAIVALDAMEKAAEIRVWQIELNDFLGTCVKIVGHVDAVRTAIEVGHKVAEQMQGRPVSSVISRMAPAAVAGINSKVEFNVLIQQYVVTEMASEKETAVSSDAIQALGFIETQGFTAVFEAVDTACKAARVEVVGKEKLGGGYVTIVIKGDVAAVRAAIDAAQPKVEGLGKLIAAHVIPRPSSSVLALLPARPAGAGIEECSPITAPFIHRLADLATVRYLPSIWSCSDDQHRIAMKLVARQPYVSFVLFESFVVV